MMEAKKKGVEGVGGDPPSPVSLILYTTTGTAPPPLTPSSLLE